MSEIVESAFLPIGTKVWVEAEINEIGVREDQSFVGVIFRYGPEGRHAVRVSVPLALIRGKSA